MFTTAKKALAAGVAALTFGGAMAASTAPAQAQFAYSWGGPAYYGYAPAYYGGHYGGYYGPRVVSSYHYGRPYYGHPYRYRRSNGGAVAAGLIGGLALGALAASAARPYYAAPAYSDCYIERQRVRDRYGRLFIRRVRVCG